MPIPARNLPYPNQPAGGSALLARALLCAWLLLCNWLLHWAGPAVRAAEAHPQLERLPTGRADFVEDGGYWLGKDPVGAPSPSVGGFDARGPLPDRHPVSRPTDYLTGDAWSWQLLPTGILYPAYLAGAKESRFRNVWTHEKDAGWLWDITLGGRVGLLRYGTTDPYRPEGYQIDIEGAALPRLDPEEKSDLAGADFRFGVPITYAVDRYQTKLAYYHLSSHLGDEFMLKNPGVTRLNYSRDVLVWGHSYYATDALRLFAEAGWAFKSDVSEPWEFQFGADYSPACATGPDGAPFTAFAASLREEVDFGGHVVVQTGWAWRGGYNSGLFRLGFEYFNGKSEQFSFFDESESKLGLGLWYDY